MIILMILFIYFLNGYTDTYICKRCIYFIYKYILYNLKKKRDVNYQPLENVIKVDHRTAVSVGLVQ